MRVVTTLLLFGVLATSIGIISCDEDVDPQEYGYEGGQASSTKTQKTETVMITILYKLKNKLEEWRDKFGHRRTTRTRELDYQIEILYKILDERKQSKEVSDRAFFSSGSDDFASFVGKFCNDMYDLLHKPKFPYADYYYDDLWPLIRNLHDLLPEAGSSVGSMSDDSQYDNNDSYY